MDIVKYIHELLFENETVIIPGFGAFISSYKPAEINEETKEIDPPSKEIIFNQQIRNNDGLLVDRVAEGEGISHFDALKKIEKERENIIYQLDKGEKVSIDKTGELFYDEDGEIQFVALQDENLLIDSYGLDTVSLEENEEKPEEELEPALVEEQVEDSPEEDLQEEDNIVDDTEPEITVEPENSKTEKPEKKKRRGWLWLLIILVPIAAVGAYFIWDKSQFKDPIETSPEETITTKTEEAVSVQDTMIKDTLPEPVVDSILVEKPDTLEIEKVVEKLPGFILVGGSFKAEENAETYLNQLKEEGFEPFHLGKRGNFYIVGIGRYETERDALRAKRKFNEENPESGVWIYEEKTN